MAFIASKAIQMVGSMSMSAKAYSRWVKSKSNRVRDVKPINILHFDRPLKV